MLNGSLTGSDHAPIVADDSLDLSTSGVDTCTTQTLSDLSNAAYGNIQTGDLALVFPTTTLDGALAIQSMRQSVPGSLQFRVCDIGGVQFNPPSFEFTVIVIR